MSAAEKISQRWPVSSSMRWGLLRVHPISLKMAAVEVAGPNARSHCVRYIALDEAGAALRAKGPVEEHLEVCLAEDGVEEELREQAGVRDNWVGLAVQEQPESCEDTARPG